MKHIFRLVVDIEVESNLDYSDALDEFQVETDYSFPSTENVKVINTELLGTDLDDI